MTGPEGIALRVSPIVGGTPKEIVVFPFSNEGILLVGAGTPDEQQDLLAESGTVAEEICQQVALKLGQSGWNAVCRERGTPIMGDNTLVVDGAIVDIVAGKTEEFKYGAGLYQYSSGHSKQLLDFTSHAPNMPRGGIATSAEGPGAGIARPDSSTLSAPDQSASQILDQLNGYFAQQRWNPGKG